MRLLSTNTLTITKNNHSLQRLTVTGKETPEYANAANAVWQAALGYYKTGISPMVGMCVYKDGKVVLNRNIGHLNRDQTQQVNLDTPICLFSVSKMITALLIHKLCELGKLRLDDKVGYYLPRYKGQGKDATTVADLLTHHSGIPKLQLQRGEKLDPNLLFNRDGIMDRLYRAPLLSPTGDSMAYHALSAGYLLGAVAEIAGDDSLENLLQYHIAKPMQLTCMHYGLPKDKRHLAAKNAATGLHPKLGADWYVTYVLNGGLQTAVDFTNDARFFDAFCPAANVFATTQDMAKLMQMLLTDGVYQEQAILQPQTVKTIKYAPYGFKFDKTLLVPMRYGHGVMHGAKPVGLFGVNSARAFGHLGFTNIFCWADPQRNISVSFMNTGKAVLGTHLPSIAKLFWQINGQLS